MVFHVAMEQLAARGESLVLKGHGFNCAVSRSKQTRALRAAEKLIEGVSKGCFVSGHDFSRAVTAAKSTGP
jgi:hypothetical protein